MIRNLRHALALFVFAFALSSIAHDADAYPVGNKVLNVSYAATTAIYSDFFASPAGSSALHTYVFATTAGFVQLFWVDPDGNQVALTSSLPVAASDLTMIDLSRYVSIAYAVFTPNTQPGSVRIYMFPAGANVH